jgi:hypothetical protein
MHELSFLVRISAVDPVDCWDDESEDGKRPIMSSSKPKMSNVWQQRFVDRSSPYLYRRSFLNYEFTI